MKRLAAAALLSVVLAFAAQAQSPAHEWRTIETAHFRVHYPAQYETWAQRAAERLEPIYDAVSKEIGFAPAQRTDVLVMNPIAEPNGSAWPLLDTPRIIFFAEPPGPDEQLGAYGTWIDLLAVHEVAHVVHMLRPSRNALDRLAESVLPLNPITLRAPRWVLEGYATVVEGRLTGAGRPSSTLRALILRQWAANGRLPTYAQLNSDRRFLGMSMAYLMGSAFLEWLEQRNGADALRTLWARMTARERRSFDGAFSGVFGDRPDRLYGQFLAEVTASAIAVKRARPVQEGVLFQETTRASGNPAVSPDGAQLAVVLRERDHPEKLVVWSTAPPAEEDRKFRERIEKILERDPEDVAPLLTKPLPREPKHELVMPDGGDIQNPRWTRDGRAIVFSHRVPDDEGFLHFDLFRWNVEGDGALMRITRRADVRDADPIDEQNAIAVRSAYGLTELVQVDLRSGAVTPHHAAPPAIDRVVASPRVSASGRIAYVAHDGRQWMLVVDDEPVSLPGDAATPAWISDDELVVTVFERGFAELYRVSGGTATPATRTGGGAFEPAPARDGRIFFMSLEPDGYVVRVLDRVDAAPAEPELDASLVPAIPPPSARTGMIAAARSVPPSHPYGIGRQELGWFLSTNVAPRQQAIEAGIRLGDVVGRLDTLLIASFGREEAPDGVALATAWRGWPVELGAHVSRADDRTAAELRGLWTRRFSRSRLTFEAGALAGDDDLLFGAGAFSTFQRVGASRFDESVRIDIDDEHWRGSASASFRVGSLRVRAEAQHDDGATVTLGGLPSSVLPRSAYAHRILDPALPVAIMSGGEYDGWRIESSVPGLPLTAFYQRHEPGDASLSLAGAELELHTAPNPIVKVPGLDLTLGAAHVFDAPLRGDTKFWIGMRWRP